MKVKTKILDHTSFFDAKVNDSIHIKIDFKGYKTEFKDYIDKLMKEL